MEQDATMDADIFQNSRLIPIVQKTKEKNLINLQVHIILNANPQEQGGNNAK